MRGVNASIGRCRALVTNRAIEHRAGLRQAAPMTRDLDGGFSEPGAQAPRKSPRVDVQAMVKLRRRAHHNFTVQAFDFSREGCKLEFHERPQLDETVWVKFEGLEGLEATVCWIDGNYIGVEFVRPIHDAVFDHLVGRFR